MLGFYTAEFNGGRIIHAVIQDGKFYYYDFTAYKYSDRNHSRKCSATLSTGEKHDSANACLIDLIENYPFVRM